MGQSISHHGHGKRLCLSSRVRGTGVGCVWTWLGTGYSEFGHLQSRKLSCLTLMRTLLWARSWGVSNSTQHPMDQTESEPGPWVLKNQITSSAFWVMKIASSMSGSSKDPPCFICLYSTRISFAMALLTLSKRAKRDRHSRSK